MGIDYNADLGYGIKLTSELADSIRNDEATYDKNLFEIMWSGDAYAGEMTEYLVLKSSTHSTWSFKDNEPIKKNKLIAPDKWDELVTAQATELGVKKPKIGWWLCSSVS